MGSGIYQIGLGNGWFYIGSAVDLAKREREHRTTLKRKVHCNNRMQNCWNKYRIFEFTISEECAPDDLLVREQFYLNTHFNDENNVNILPTAGSTLGYIHSAEAKAKMSGPRSAEHRAKLSAAGRNRKFSVETRAKLSAWQIGSKKSPASAETRAKLSAATSAVWVMRKAQAA